MWLIQIFVGGFWLYMGTALLFREALFWRSVENIDWFRKRYQCSSSAKWERFCRDAGFACFAIGGLLFLTLPQGIGVLGVVLLLPILLMLR